MNRQAPRDKPAKEGGSSLLMRFATSTALLAMAVVLIAVIFVHAIRGDIFHAAFQSPLKEWSATVAGHIGSDPVRAQGVARTHKVGIIVSTADERFAFGPDGEPVDADKLLEDTSRFRRIDVHIQHGTHTGQLQYSFMLDKEQFGDDQNPRLMGLVALLLITIGLAYAIQLHLLRPLKWLRSGVEAVSEGEFSTRVPVVRDDEIGKVARSFNQMTDRARTALTAGPD
jgi:HAMP domain-containing protein